MTTNIISLNCVAKYGTDEARLWRGLIEMNNLCLELDSSSVARFHCHVLHCAMFLSLYGLIFAGFAPAARLPRQDAGPRPRAARHRRRAPAPPVPQAGRAAGPPRPPHEAVQVLKHATT